MPSTTAIPQPSECRPQPSPTRRGPVAARAGRLRPAARQHGPSDRPLGISPKSRLARAGYRLAGACRYCGGAAARVGRAAPTIRAFRPPRSLSRASERGLWGNANVGRILAGSRRWNPAMSSRTHSPPPSPTAQPPTREPGTAVFGCAEPCWDRPWQKVERPSAPTSGRKPRLRHASGRAARTAQRLCSLARKTGRREVSPRTKRTPGGR